jgi:hypothetical protein
MSEIKHTPGPWGVSAISPNIVVQHDFMGATNVQVGSASGYTGSPFFPSDEEAIANARLIAAAPELLEALKEAIETIKFLSTRDNSWGEQIVCEDLQAIVAKATGSKS